MIFYQTTWKGGAVLKAIIMSHENGGSYCIDSTGSFHFVKGYEDVDIGTEIVIETKKPARFRKYFIACAAVVITVAIVGFTCAKIASSLHVRALGSNNGEAIYARICLHDSTRYCLTDIRCCMSCPYY